MQCAESQRVHLYFDNEVDAASVVEIEQHLQRCDECQALLRSLQQSRTQLKNELTDFRASPALRIRLRKMLDQEQSQPNIPTASIQPQSRTRPFWWGVLGGASLTSIAATLIVFLLLPPFTRPLTDDLLNAHLQSLMSTHLMDVVSTDKHTVKPWFATHTDVSPIVADFESQGYRLMGGRVDYIDHQRAAVTIYQHGPHIVNVFSWADGQRSVMQRATRNGYHMIFWKAGDLTYCAMSDAAPDELSGLVHLLQNAGATDHQEQK